MNLSTDELIVKITATINRGIAQALISVDGHLIFVMSDGEQIDIGDIQGPVLEALKAYVDQNQVVVDETLTKQGQAADAFAVGDAFREMEDDIRYRLPESGGTMTGTLNMGGNSITGADSVQAAALAVTPVGSDPDAGGYLAAGESELRIAFHYCSITCKVTGLFFLIGNAYNVVNSHIPSVDEYKLYFRVIRSNCLKSCFL